MEEEKLAVNVQHYFKKVGKFQLYDITFSLKEGYIMGLVGRMGSGKSTLLRCLIQGEIPGKAGNKGSIEIVGGVGAVTEEMPFLIDATLKENAELYGSLYPDYDMELFQDYLRKIGLGSHLVYGLLSKGEKMKFQLAFAMSHQPKVLILDEPTAGLDASFRGEFLRMIQEYVEVNMASVIISTHMIEDLNKVADYIGYMENGELVKMEERVR